MKLLASRLVETVNPHVRVSVALREQEGGEREVLLWPMVQTATGEWIESATPTDSERDLLESLADQLAGLGPAFQEAFVRDDVLHRRRKLFRRCGAMTRGDFPCLIEASKGRRRCHAHEGA